MIVRPLSVAGNTAYREYFWDFPLPGGTYSFSSDGTSIGLDTVDLGIIYNTDPTAPFPQLTPAGSWTSCFCTGTEDGPRVTAVHENLTLSGPSRQAIIVFRMYGVDVDGNDLYIAGDIGMYSPLAGEEVATVNGGGGFLQVGFNVHNDTPTPQPTYGIRFESLFVYVNDHIDVSIFLPSSVRLAGTPN